MRRLLFLVLMLSSVGVWAEEYYWTFDNRYISRTQFPSAKAACDYYLSTGGDNLRFKTLDMLSETKYLCQLERISDGATGGFGATISRSGDSCFEGTEYNPATGSCDEPEPDECADKEGQEQLLRKSGTAPDAFMWISSGGEFYITEERACFQGCQLSGVDSKCLTKVSGEYNCRATGTFTGAKCTASTGQGDSLEPPMDGSDDLELPPPVKDEDYTPCIYEVRPDGSKACVSETTIEQEGMSCGVANGQMVCSSSNPTKDELKVTTTVTEKTNADGSTETTKTDQADYVTCVGAKCTTSTSTSTTTTTKDGNGNVTNINGSCSGPLCADKNTNPDGDGDGFGDCIGPDCGDGGSFDGAELGEVSTFQESAEDFMERAGNAPIMQAVTGLAFPTGGTCSFGAASTAIGTISLDGMCENSHWLDPLYPVFLGVWGFAAIRKFMEA